MNEFLKQIFKYIGIAYLFVALLFLFYGLFIYEPYQEPHIVKRIVCFETYVPSDFNFTGFLNFSNLSTDLNSS